LADDPRLRGQIEIVGTQRTVVYAQAANGDMKAREFLDSLVSPGSSHEPDMRKIKELCERLAAHGTIPNKERFVREKDEIWSLKSFQVRVGAFQVGRIWFLTHGFIKKCEKWPKSELDRADEIRIQQLTRLGINR
jgi:phage-related protein